MLFARIILIPSAAYAAIQDLSLGQKPFEPPQEVCLA